MRKKKKSKKDGQIMRKKREKKREAKRRGFYHPRINKIKKKSKKINKQKVILFLHKSSLLIQFLIIQ